MIGLLIADDEMLERKVLYKTLQKNLGDRCLIYEAENGRQALELYRANDIHILILDIEMPGINGIEAAEQVRRQDKDCCIIFLTAFDEFAYARKAITVRAMDYLLKPFDETELLLLLEEAIRQAERRLLPPDSALLREESEPLPKAPEQTLTETDMPSEEAEDFENGRLWKVREMIDRYIRENYMYDISMQDLARFMNYSEAYLCKLFKQCFGRNFTSCLTEYRVGMAKAMMEQPTVSIKEIGRTVGYGDPNYFAKVFKRVTGQSPSDYRAELFRQ